MSSCRFSIIIPVFNRERIVDRALASCLAQRDADFELVVVDDGSTDATVEVVRKWDDPRLRLLCHDSNCGEGFARTSGVNAASGEWIVFLDSDDELLPGALSFMDAAIRVANPAIDRFGFTYERDDGRLSPSPLPGNREMDFATFLGWQECLDLYDFLSCTRRCTFEKVRFENSRRFSYPRYHLDFASRYRSYFSNEVLGRIHTDAGNRASFLMRKPEVAIRHAPALGEDLDQLLLCHGDALRRHAAPTHRKLQRLRASYYFLEGARRRGVEQMTSCLRETPFSLEAWSLLIIGLTGRSAFARVRSWRAPPT